jgi:hypothetical protein
MDPVCNESLQECSDQLSMNVPESIMSVHDGQGVMIPGIHLNTTAESAILPEKALLIPYEPSLYTNPDRRSNYDLNWSGATDSYSDPGPVDDNESDLEYPSHPGYSFTSQSL